MVFVEYNFTIFFLLIRFVSSMLHKSMSGTNKLYLDNVRNVCTKFINIYLESTYTICASYISWSSFRYISVDGHVESSVKFFLLHCMVLVYLAIAKFEKILALAETNKYIFTHIK